MDINVDFSSFEDSKAEESIIARLQRAWILERAAPDILPHETRLLETVSARLKDQAIPKLKGLADTRLPGLRKNLCLREILNVQLEQSLFKLKSNESSSSSAPISGRVYTRSNGCLLMPIVD